MTHPHSNLPEAIEAGLAFQGHLREMNEELLVSLVRQHELTELAQKAEALSRTSEERYQALFGLVPVAVYSCDAFGVIQTFNRRAVELWGREPEPGDTDERFCGSLKLIRPDGSYLPHDQCPVALVLRSEIPEVSDAEVIIERPDGTQVTVVVNVRPFIDQHGVVTGVINCFYDITERKRAELLLASQKEVLELAANGAVMEDVLELIVRSAQQHVGAQSRPCVFLVEPDGLHMDIIVAADLSADYIRAVRHFEVGPHSPSCGVAAFTGQLVIVSDVSKDPNWAPFRNLANEHEIRAVWSQPLRTLSGKVLGTLAIYHRKLCTPSPIELEAITLLSQTAALVIEQNTEQKQRIQAEAALRASEARQRFMLSSMPQKIFTARAGGEMDYFNPEWAEYTGQTFGQLKSGGWRQFIHSDDAALNVRMWQHCIATGEPFHCEHRFRRGDGEYRWHLSRARPMRDEQGNVLMWVGSSTDVHEVKEADRRKNEFLAMLAHELRNPLAPIRNGLQILRVTGHHQESRQAASEMMERQIVQMVRLVDDLLDVSRISQGKITLRKETIELTSVVNQAVEAARSLYDSMNQKLIVTLPPQPIFVNGDPARLAQVVGNLLNNACKFTDPDGQIRLTVSIADFDRSAIRNAKSETVEIRVRDTGIGIAPDQLPHIFTMFVQIDTSLERSVSGLGIGLTLVKNLVEMHGGTVEAQSAGIGHGTEFIVRLPIQPQEQGQPSKPTIIESPRTSHRILIVDDNRDSAASLAMLMKLTGNVTQAAYDGIEAVEAVATFRPKVVLLDIGLPRLNGYDACRTLRAQPDGKNLVLIAVTGWGNDEDRRKTKEAGFDGHLVKPVDYSALTKLLAELLPTPLR